ncbi:hypothetical protein Ppro_2578 [Pelobacter propionicus DSM 2379]|uniref:Uncharacterized protein n=1 Tax=Pelobacter propionicus (strain DSM 2379 / NBRC 103807 / OttBd1) TaxID=338966 RepID=A1AS62_PELPD|nr:hypothetical protein Ppro_2578 [Pelobacter propionicus DSM 2379]
MESNMAMRRASPYFFVDKIYILSPSLRFFLPLPKNVSETGLTCRETCIIAANSFVEPVPRENAPHDGGQSLPCKAAVAW